MWPGSSISTAAPSMAFPRRRTPPRSAPTQSQNSPRRVSSLRFSGCDEFTPKRPPVRLPDPALLVVTDRRQARRPLAEVVGAALTAGCRWISLREKDLPDDEQ